MRSQEPPEPIIFFIDRSLGGKIVPGVLRSRGAIVIAHDDRFARDAPDSDWLRVAGRERWVVLTQDARIRYRTIERLAVQQSGARVFVLVSHNLQGGQVAQAFAAALHPMERFVRKNKGPFIAKVYRDGRIQLWIDLSKTAR